MSFIYDLILGLLLGLAELWPIGGYKALQFLPGIRGYDLDWVAIAGFETGLAIGLGIFVRKDINALVKALRQFFKGKRRSEEFHLLQSVLLAFAPLLIWISLSSFLPANPISTLPALKPRFIGGTLLALGFILLIVDHYAMRVRRIEHLTKSGTLALGLLLLGIIYPGIGLMTLVITGLRLAGYERIATLRFAVLLLAHLIISNAILLNTTLGLGSYQVELSPWYEPIFWIALPIGISLALGASSILFAWIERHSFFLPALFIGTIGIALVLGSNLLPGLFF